MNHTKKFAMLALGGALSLGVALPSLAIDPGTMNKVAEAARLVGEANKLYTALGSPNAVTPPAPVTGNRGKFMNPYKADGTLTEWAQKALSAKAGSTAGGVVGQQAAGQLAARVPFVGGLFGGKAKQMAEEKGAVMAIGGEEFIRSSSDSSFESVDDLAVYLHVKHSTSPGFAEALSGTMDVYPDLKSRYVEANRLAQERAKAPAP